MQKQTNKVVWGGSCLTLCSSGSARINPRAAPLPLVRAFNLRSCSFDRFSIRSSLHFNRDISGERTNVKRVAMFTLAGLLVCVSQQSVCQSNSSLDENLWHSQLCAKAAKEFRSQPEWKDVEDTIFTSHFNTKLGKCLVMAKSTNLVQEQHKVLEMQHVYDAIEGTVLCGKILVKEIPHDGEQKTLTITMVKDGKTLKNKDEFREAYQWFETLMKE